MLRPSHCLSLLQHHAETFSSVLHSFFKVSINIIIHVFFRTSEKKVRLGVCCLNYTSLCADLSFVVIVGFINCLTNISMLWNAQNVSQISFTSVYLVTHIGFC